jgi:hypothetical protein
MSTRPLTSAQRQNRLEHLFPELARRYARSLGLGYVGTIRQLPPPPLPGEQPGATRYYLNGLVPKGGGTHLVEFSPALYATVRRAEHWVETGRGPLPALPGIGQPKGRKRTLPHPKPAPAGKSGRRR